MQKERDRGAKIPEGAWAVRATIGSNIWPRTRLCECETTRGITKEGAKDCPPKSMVP